MAGNAATISSEKEENHEEKYEERATRREFNYTSFKCSFQLPENLKQEDISAKYLDGALKLQLLKRTVQRGQGSKRIEIQ